MYKTIILLIFSTFLLVSTITSGEEDYRPHYYFSDDVFQELPSFPNDFFMIKHMVDTQQIMPYRLNESYYLQPEILPCWNYTSELYYNQSTDDIGQYGLGFYPSLFDVYNAQVGDRFSLGCIVYCNPGIDLFQGGKITVSNQSFVNVSVSQDYFILGFTYPFFNKSWSTVIRFDIEVLEEKNGVVEVFEASFDENNISSYKEQFKDVGFVSGNSLISMKTPRVRIVFHKEMYEAGDVDTDSSGFPFVQVVLLVFILFSLLIGGFYAKHRFTKKQWF